MKRSLHARPTGVVKRALPTAARGLPTVARFRWVLNARFLPPRGPARWDRPAEKVAAVACIRGKFDFFLNASRMFIDKLLVPPHTYAAR